MLLVVCQLSRDVIGWLEMSSARFDPSIVGVNNQS